VQFVAAKSCYETLNHLRLHYFARDKNTLSNSDKKRNDEKRNDEKRNDERKNGIMKIVVMAILVLASTCAFAGRKKEHRHHEAHVHGGATLSIAFDQLKGQVEFRAASEGVLGFEYEAKSEKEIKKLNETIANFEATIDSMIKFDEVVGCIFKKEKIEMVAEKKDQDEKDHKKQEGGHSDFVASFSVECKSGVKGTKVIFDFSQFKGLKDVEVTVLVGDLQKSAEVRKKQFMMDLK
jgi:hypothetical protein